MLMKRNFERKYREKVIIEHFQMHKMPSTRMPEPDPETIVVGKVEEQEVTWEK